MLYSTRKKGAVLETKLIRNCSLNAIKMMNTAKFDKLNITNSHGAILENSVFIHIPGSIVMIVMMKMS